MEAGAGLTVGTKRLQYASRETVFATIARQPEPACCVGVSPAAVLGVVTVGLSLGAVGEPDGEAAGVGGLVVGVVTAVGVADVESTGVPPSFTVPLTVGVTGAETTA